MKTIVHVNQHVIRANNANGADAPVLTVKDRFEGKARNRYAHEVVIDGPSTVVYDGRQLSCGARCWIETAATVALVVREDVAP
jgi:hypothetical protein